MNSYSAVPRGARHGKDRKNVNQLEAQEHLSQCIMIQGTKHLRRRCGRCDNGSARLGGARCAVRWTVSSAQAQGTCTCQVALDGDNHETCAARAGGALAARARRTRKVEIETTSGVLQRKTKAKTSSF